MSDSPAHQSGIHSCIPRRARFTASCLGTDALEHDLERGEAHRIAYVLDDIGVSLEGMEAVVVGRSNIVGKPMALLLLRRSATVTICTSRTRDLASHTRRADILVVATGRPRMVTGDMIKPGGVVIDVGINRLPDGKLAGDVDFEAAREVAGWITPVPGGVGPMTIAMLLSNTVLSAERAVGTTA